MKKLILLLFIFLFIFFSKSSVSFASTIYSNDFKTSISDFHFYFGSCILSDSGMTCDHAVGITNTAYAAAKCVSFDATNTDGIPQVFVSDNDLNNRIFASFQSGETVQVYLEDSGETHWDTGIPVPNGVHNLQLCEGTNHISVYIDDSLIWEQDATFPHFDHPGFYVQNGTTLTNFVVSDMLPEVTIAAFPPTGIKTVGTPFNVTIAINSSAKAFNAAKATVAVSSNLSIIGLHNSPSPACNFQYTKTPTTSDPSFAGAIFGSSSSSCNVYTVTLTPNAAGEGTIASQMVLSKHIVIIRKF